MPQKESEKLQITPEEGSVLAQKGKTSVRISKGGDVTVETEGSVTHADLPATETLSVSGDFNTVSFGGAAVRFEAAGISVSAKGSVRSVAVRPLPAAPKPPAIGTAAEDGCLYAGVSPDTGRAMYVAPADEKRRGKRNFSTPEAARKRALKKSIKTGRDFRLPSYAELQVLFNNRAALGGFDESGRYPKSLYRSYNSGSGKGRDRCRNFGTGAERSLYSDYGFSVRFVRS